MATILGCDSWADIKGKVVDESGKPIVGAKIILMQGNSKVDEQLTDANGRIDVFKSICPMPGCSTDISFTVLKAGYHSVITNYDANKDGNAMRKGDLVIVLTRE